MIFLPKIISCLETPNFKQDAQLEGDGISISDMLLLKAVKVTSKPVSQVSSDV